MLEILRERRYLSKDRHRLFCISFSYGIAWESELLHGIQMPKIQGVREKQRSGYI